MTSRLRLAAHYAKAVAAGVYGGSVAAYVEFPAADKWIVVGQAVLVGAGLVAGVPNAKRKT